MPHTICPSSPATDGIGCPSKRSAHKQETPVVVIAVFTIGLALLLGLSHPAFGTESAPQDFPDRLKFWGGYQMLFGLDAKFRFDGPRTGLGSTFDFGDDLGGDEDDNMLRAGALVRFTPNHAIGFSWYAINLRGDRTILDVDLQIDDLIFSAKGQISSKNDLTLYRIFYNWSFYRSDRVELRLSPGMYFGGFEAKFVGSATINPGDFTPVSRGAIVKESLFAPLPTIGLGIEYKILPRLTAHLRADFFYVNINQVEGSLAELFIGLEYRLFKHFAVGTAFNRLWLDLDWKPGTRNGWEINSSWNGGLFYGALYF